MAGQTIANFSNALKTRYLGPIREELNGATVLLSRIGRNDNAINVSGKTFTIPLHTSRNVFAGSGRADGGTLPQVGEQGYSVAVVPNAYIYTRIKVTGPTIRAARDAAGAFTTAVESEIRGGLADTKRSVNRQLNGDGSDALAFWTGADDTSGVTVDDGRGHAFSHLPAGTAVTCDLIDASDNSTKLGDSIVVTQGAKNATTYSATFTGSVSGSADGDYLVLEDTLGKQMMGIAGVIDNANPVLLSGGLHGIDAANTYWQAQVNDGGGTTDRALTLDLMQDPLDQIAMNSDFDETDVEFLFGNYPVRAKYLALLRDEKRFVNTLTLDGGWTGLAYNDKPFIVDSQAKRGTIFYVNPATLSILRTADFDWADQDGSILSRVSGEDAYDAFLYAYMNLACTARNGNGVLKYIAE